MGLIQNKCTERHNISSEDLISFSFTHTALFYFPVLGLQNTQAISQRKNRCTAATKAAMINPVSRDSALDQPTLLKGFFVLIKTMLDILKRRD
jgi:hypothetical protein